MNKDTKKNIVLYVIIAIISGTIAGLLLFYINGLKITNRIDQNSRNINSIVEYINKNIVVSKQTEAITQTTQNSVENNTGE